MKYHTWIKVGMAVHSWNANKAGLDIWEEWSQAGNNYEAGKTQLHWKSFSHDKSDGVTLATLRHLEKDANLSERHDLVDKFIETVSYSAANELVLSVYPDIRKENFSDFEINRIATAIQKRWMEIEGHKPPISGLREDIRPEKEARNVHKPKWCSKFVYINNINRYFSIMTHIKYNAEGFNLLNGVNVPSWGKGKTAKSFVEEYGFIDIVDGGLFLPHKPQEYTC